MHIIIILVPRRSFREMYIVLRAKDTMWRQKDYQNTLYWGGFPFGCMKYVSFYAPNVVPLCDKGYNASFYLGLITHDGL